jgi:hypothetical protein
VASGSPSPRLRRVAAYEPPLRAGSVLGRTFSAWSRNVLPVTLASILVHLPLLAFAGWLFADEDTFRRRHDGAWEDASGIVTGVLGVVLAAALTFGVFRQIQGRPATLTESLSVGLRRLLPALATGTVAGVLTYLPLAVAVGIGVATGAGDVGTGGLTSVASIAMLMLQTALWVAVPAAVVERPGVLGAIRRSFRLTRGSRWRILGVNLVLGVIGVGLTLAFGYPAFRDDPSLADLRRGIFVQVATAALVLNPLGAIASIVGYHDLRVGKEGADVEDLARVFE